MKFKQYLNEKEMPLQQAMDIFGITNKEIGDPVGLKKLHRKLSIKNHPDRGGSTEKMQDVNAAYDVLKKIHKMPTTKKFDWEALAAEYRVLGKKIRDDLVENFNPNIFISYLNEITGKEFKHELLSKFPTDQHIKENRDVNFAGFISEFSTSDKNTIFTMRINSSLSDATSSKSLGSSNNSIKYNVSLETSVLHDNKSHKLTRSNWNFTSDHSRFTDPKKIFPKAKVKKIVEGKSRKNSKFKKRDMILFLKKKLGGAWDGDVVRIPLHDDFEIILFRSTFMREGMWGVNGLYKKVSRIERFRGMWIEDEALALDFEKVIKDAKKIKDEDKLKKFLTQGFKWIDDNYKKRNNLK